MAKTLRDLKVINMLLSKIEISLSRNNFITVKFVTQITIF